MFTFVSTRPCRGTGLRLRLRNGILCLHRRSKPVIKVSSLTLPVFNPLVWNIMKAKGIDAKHGFELDAKAYPSISAFPRAFPTGETDVLIGVPTISQKLYQEGVPVRIIGTGFTARRSRHFHQERRHQIAGRSEGNSSAVDMGGSQFQVTKSCTAAKGIDLGKDISGSSTPTSRWPARSLGPTASTPRSSSSRSPASSPSKRSRPGKSFSTARGRWKENSPRRRRLGNRHRDACRCYRKKSERAEDADRSIAGRLPLHVVEHRRGRQDRQ